MPKKKSNRWTTHEINAIKAYALDQALHLTANMYKNIFAGSIRYPKRKGFYKDLSAITRRTHLKCKSKFQKMERHLYVDVLKVDPATFDLFLWTRFKTRNRVEREKLLRRPIAKKTSRNLRRSQTHRHDQSSARTNKFARDSRKYGKAARRQLEKVRLGLVAKWLRRDPDLPEVTSSGLRWPR